MNRLILVGNGFDLAHGLKTSYKDFLIWYLAECFGSRSYLPSIYKDELLQIEFKDFYSFTRVVTAYKEGVYHSGYTKDDLIYFIASHFEQRTIKELLNINEKYIPVFIIADSDHFSVSDDNRNEPFKVNVLSDLLKNLIINCQDCNWVDVENEYFEALKNCKNREGQFDFKKVNQLNDELQFIKGKLKEYLEIQQKNARVSVKGNLIAHIKSKYNISDFDTTVDYENLRQKLGFDDRFKEEDHYLYVVNFNYTDTFNHYKDHVIEQSIFRKVEINHIHGELYELKNPLIFGFGDEHDKDYLTFEEQGNNDLFTHIKSYQYFNTPNYRNLIRFLNSGDYQVFIMGHSCGLSDRTMFKEIFDHEHCKSVKIFHYQKPDGTNDFWEKTVNLGRHFSDKGRMRKLIVEFDEANAFPQCN
ncbi:hypothetical protein Pedsa_1271 [Pseudopedobacter saltans DSM 12145]|uniref:Bacteriophage abortive infection AbiH n=1 Tax=Pseudopedobacter saltans (strain ATCC 51119 / DSM 12145 / JCM 21818 / CCUG 39354 / LMG 10337 / NBRC 100064 / NCIMB 13643) TaxID=762903 RepID=F0SDU2_PSESL|nr:AbiH family protein [Pseudopedobacter saltans]ADY51838.1 hypothetical protein Pedsa_1271 [Pseudopedobacter saltans DSM 12145]